MMQQVVVKLALMVVMAAWGVGVVVPIEVKGRA